MRLLGYRLRGHKAGSDTRQGLDQAMENKNKAA